MAILEHNICAICGKKADYNTIKHRNDFLHDKIAFHSSCIKKQFELDGYNPVNVLRILNIPFINHLWETVEESGNYETKDGMITEYIRIIGPRRMYKHFMDSEFEEINAVGEFQPTQEMVKRWGPKLDDISYLTLEETYNQLVKLKEPTTKSEESRYIQNAWLNKRLKDALMSGTSSDIKNMQAAYESDLKAIGLDSASVSGRDNKKSLGQRIAEWETEGPTPKLGDEFKDVDKIGRYLEKFFRKPVARNFNKLDAKEERDIDNYDSSIVPGSDDDG